MSGEETPFVIRPTTEAEVEPMLAIYRHHIERGVDATAMRDAELIQPEEMKRRRKNFRNRTLPHLAAVRDGVLSATPMSCRSESVRPIATP